MVAGAARRRRPRAARFPVTLLWGPELVLLYNEAFVPLIADKHPTALGRRASEVFPEAWGAIGPMLRGVLAGRGATWVEDELVPLRRHGLMEEAYFTFSYSPVRSEHGAIEGVMDIATETTDQVLDRRRQRLLGRLGKRVGDAEDVEHLTRRAASLLREDPRDLRACDIRLGGAPAVVRDARLPERPATPLGHRDVLVEERPAGRVAWVPLTSTRATLPESVLVVLLSEHLPPDEAYLRFLRSIARTLGQALNRIGTREGGGARRRGRRPRAVRDAAAQPPLRAVGAGPPRGRGALPAGRQSGRGGRGLVRLLPAAGRLAHAGHRRRDGARPAGGAAAMAQVRNLLRGVAYTLLGPPSRVLSGLDQAMHGLAVGAYATAVPAKVEQHEEEAAQGLRTLRWSNAGHPPPVLIAPDGHARLLERESDPLLGLAGGERNDHAVTLEPGASVIFYTDGLIERRGVALEDSFDALIEVLQGSHTMSADDLCDQLLARLDAAAEDDVALLILRTHPEDRVRPPAAGPQVLPADLRST